VKFLISYVSRPIRVFGGLGLWSFSVGFLTAAGLLVNWVLDSGRHNIAQEHGGLLLLSVLLMLAGVQFFTMGLSAEIGARVYHSVAGRRIYTVREVREHAETTGT